MGDSAEIFKAMTKYKKKKRKKNTKESTEILKDKGVWFESKNDGAHLIVTGKLGKIDYWPSTGLFIPRYNQKRMRGVFNLLREVFQNA